jgi:transposase
MARLSRIGIDTSKSVFQLHGVDEEEQSVLRKQLRSGRA